MAYTGHFFLFPSWVANVSHFYTLVICYLLDFRRLILMK